MLSTAALRSALAQSTGVVWLELITIEHLDLTTVRAVNNTEQISSRGNTFEPFPFALKLPTQDGEQQPVAEIRISNVGREIIDSLRGLDGIPTVTLEVVTDADLDNVEWGPKQMDIIGVPSYNVDSITFRLSYERILQQPFPADSFNPALFPRLFD
ncbi:DUF1833 family protein [Algiphilus sp.]|uniref:DUF1833 family protein n=1 Tax=Algiphilus sp. TaxID=1872431 RepID=UPI003CCBDE60